MLCFLVTLCALIVDLGPFSLPPSLSVSQPLPYMQTAAPEGASLLSLPGWGTCASPITFTLQPDPGTQGPCSLGNGCLLRCLRWALPPAAWAVPCLSPCLALVHVSPPGDGVLYVCLPFLSRHAKRKGVGRNKGRAQVAAASTNGLFHLSQESPLTCGLCDITVGGAGSMLHWP